MVKKPRSLKKAARELDEAEEDAKDAAATKAARVAEPAVESDEKAKKKKKARPAKMRRDNRKKREEEKKEQGRKERDENNELEDEEHLNKRLLVKNLPENTTRQELRELFEKFGTVHRARLFVNSHGVFKGVGFVTFENEDEFNAAFKVNGMEFKKNTLQVTKADPPPQKPFTNIFVAGLPFTAEEAKIRKHFKSCGDIREVRMQIDQVRKSFNGIAFLSFKTGDGAQAALKLHESAFAGRSILVKKANPKKKPLAKEKKALGNQPSQPANKHEEKKDKKKKAGAEGVGADQTESAPAPEKKRKVAEDAPEVEEAPTKKKKKRKAAEA